MATTAFLARPSHHADEYKRRYGASGQELGLTPWANLDRRSPARETVLRPWLDSVFGDRAYRIVCDDKLCDLFVRDGGDCSWMLSLQTQNDRFSIWMPWMSIGCSGAHFNYEIRAPLAH